MSWRELIGRSVPDELAGFLLCHLEWDSEERLLALEIRDRQILYDYFSGLAFEELDRMELPRSEWRAIGSSPLLLTERALEEQGRVREAAALYALSHDIALEDPGALARFDRLFLRFKLGHALLLLDEDAEDNVRRCEELANRTVSLLNRLGPSQEVPLPLFRFLLFKLQRWRAARQGDLGEARRAVETFRAAWHEADDPDDRVDCLVSAVSSLETLGELQEAYGLLLQGRDDVSQVQDEDTRRLWGLQLGSLQLKLGGRLDALEGQLDPADQGMARILGQVLEKDVLLAGEVAGAEIFLSSLDPSTLQEGGDVDLRHRLLCGHALLAFDAKEPQRAEQILSEAERLEAGPEQDRLRLDRRILLARGHFQFGSAASAARELSSLLEEAERLLGPEERLSFLGHFLETLTKDTSAVDAGATGEWVDRLTSLYEALLAAQPGAPARRRVREMQQRPIESAVAALVSTANRAGEASPVGQRMLARAWSVLMQIRNPELQIPRSALAGAPEDDALRDLEEAFHIALRDSFTGCPAGDWRGLLKSLWEHEIIMSAAPRAGGGSRSELPQEGLAVAFFQFRALFVDRPLLVLVAQDGRLRLRIVHHAERDLLNPLVSWGERLDRSSSPPAARHMSGEEEPQESEAGEPWTGAEGLPDLFAGVLSEPSAGSWTIFPDDLLHQFPIEMLPFRPTPDRVLGECFPVRLCLRSSVLEEWNRRLDLSRGWLGLGGAPRLGHEDHLPNAVVEIESLCASFAERGFPATALLASEAHTGNLLAQLESLQPAVLHFAVHGYSDGKYPEACTLILAPDPDCGGGELLPFRRIRELPLTGVELVVLSACSSLAGRSGKSAGIEGLAWAFLQAGAGQVIATRYDINDAAACHLIQVLYRHLFEVPAAEALRRMREECLHDPKVGPREVGAWSLWS